MTSLNQAASGLVHNNRLTDLILRHKDDIAEPRSQVQLMISRTLLNRDLALVEGRTQAAEDLENVLRWLVQNGEELLETLEQWDIDHPRPSQKAEPSIKWFN